MRIDMVTSKLTYQKKKIQTVPGYLATSRTLCVKCFKAMPTTNLLYTGIVLS